MIRAAPTIVALSGLLYVVVCCMTLSDHNSLRAIEYLIRATIFACCVRLLYKQRPIALFLYTSVFVFYLVLGLINGNRVGYLMADLMSFLVLIFLFLFNTENRDYFTYRFVNLFSFLLSIGLVCSLYFFATNGLRPAESLGGRLSLDNVAEGDFFKYSLAIVQISVLLLPFSWQVDAVRRWIIYCGVIFFFIVSAFTLARVGIASVLVSCLLTVYIGVKGDFIRLGVRTMGTTVLLMAVFVAVVVEYWDVVSSLVHLASLRFGELGGDEIEPRDLEAAAYFANSSLGELIVGKGFGGVNNYPFGRFSERGMLMLHRGENNLILKGGVLYMFFLYGAALVSILKLIRSKSHFSNQWAIVIILFLFIERGHQQYSQYFMFSLFTLGISYGWAVKSRVLRQ